MIYGMKKKLGTAFALCLCIGLGMSNTTFARVRKVIQKEYYVVSRMEGNVVVLENENGQQITMERSKLPKRIQEEDILSYSRGRYRKDVKKTKERKKRIQAYVNQLWNS